MTYRPRPTSFRDAPKLRFRSGARLPLALAAGLASTLMLLSCVATREPGLPSRNESRNPPVNGYEFAPILEAALVLPEELVRGPHHRVADDVGTDGLTHSYRIESEFGSFEVRSNDLLRIRIREINALAVLQEMSATQEFAEALARAVGSPFVATWNLIRHPVDSIVGLPIGAWNTVQRASALARSDRSKLEDGALSEFIGFESRKRRLAGELGVDPYSSNRVLQKELNRFSWVAYVGGLPGLFIPFTGNVSPLAIQGNDDDSQRLRELLLHESPEDLGRLNRLELAVMGVPDEVSKAFVGHAWYSPRHETLLVEALVALEPALGRGVFVKAALHADSENEAFFYQRLAELLRAYSETVSGIVAIVDLDGTLAAISSEGRLVAPLVVDHAVWSPAAEAFVESFASATTTLEGVTGREILLTGTVSQKARREAELLGLEVTERAFRELRANPGDGTPVVP